MIVRLILLLICTNLIVCSSNAQGTYYAKVESGYLSFRHNTIDYDVGPGWKGHNLRGENGLEVSVINGFSFNKKLFTGIGLGYLNFEGLHGLTAFSDFEYLPLKTKLTPLINLKIGYSHLWNQYENGTGTALVCLEAGLTFRLSEKLGIYAKSGVVFTQESQLIPIRFGLRFQ